MDTRRRAVASLAIALVVVSVCPADDRIPPPRVIQLRGEVPQNQSPAVAWSSDGKWFAASWIGASYVFNAKSGKPQSICANKNLLESLHFANSGKLLFGPSGGEMRMPCFDTSSGRLVSNIPLPNTVGRQVAVTSQGDRFAVASVIKAGENRVVDVNLWDVKTGKALGSTRLDAAEVRGLEFSNDGGLLALAQSSKIVLMKTSDLSETSVLDDDSWTPNRLTFSPDGKLLATNYRYRVIKIWNVAERKIVSKLTTAVKPATQTEAPGVGAEPTSPTQGQLRTWTSADGKFTVVAELIKNSAAAVRLKREDGRVITVSKSMLSEADLEFLKNVRAP